MKPRPLFFHSRKLEHTVYGTVEGLPILPTLPEPDCSNGCDGIGDFEYHDALHFDTCYRWLEERLGFWPIFLAVGPEDAIGMTGYQHNWRRVVRSSREGRILRKPGESPDVVLFVWKTPLPGIVYSDYGDWHWILNSVEFDRENPHIARLTAIPPRVEKMVFHPSWPPSRWLRASMDPNGDAVQGLVPALDLRTADEVWCRREASRRALIRMGFRPERVLVQRVTVHHPVRRIGPRQSVVRGAT